MGGEIECEATMKWKTRNGKNDEKKEEILKLRKEVWKKWREKKLYENFF